MTSHILLTHIVPGANLRSGVILRFRIPSSTQLGDAPTFLGCNGSAQAFNKLTLQLRSVNTSEFNCIYSTYWLLLSLPFTITDECFPNFSLKKTSVDRLILIKIH